MSPKRVGNIADEGTGGTKRVCIVGAGPSGLAAAKYMAKAGIDVCVYEASGDIGGQWNMSSSMSAVWPSLFMNGSRRAQEFSDFPWEEAIPDPPAKDFAGLFANQIEAKAYLDAYADEFELRRFVHLNTQVKSVEILDNDRWCVQTANSSKIFDFVVCCSGLYSNSNDPLTQHGKPLAKFSGTLVHSSKFKEIVEALEGKRVLVVGNSVSGGEIATETVSRRASYVVHSMRSPKYTMETLMMSDNGELCSYDDIIYGRLPVWLGRILPKSVMDHGFTSMVTKHFHQPVSVGDRFKERKGAQLTHLPYAKLVDAGEIILKPEPTSTNGSSKVEFSDGSVDEFDVVITATGYKIQLDYLPSHVCEEVLVEFYDNIDIPLYKHTLHPSYPTLAFVGFRCLAGYAWPVIEMQARFASEVFSGRHALPSCSKMKGDLQAWRSKREKSNIMFPPEVQEDIADEMGISPGILSALRDGKHLLSGTIYACYYSPEDTKESALQRFYTYIDKPLTASLTQEERELLRIQSHHDF